MGAVVNCVSVKSLLGWGCSYQCLSQGVAGVGVIVNRVSVKLSLGRGL